MSIDGGRVPATLLLLDPREVLEGEGCSPPLGVAAPWGCGCCCCCCLGFLDVGEAGARRGELLAHRRGSADPTFLMLLLEGPPGFSMAATDDHFGGCDCPCSMILALKLELTYKDLRCSTCGMESEKSLRKSIQKKLIQLASGF